MPSAAGSARTPALAVRRYDRDRPAAASKRRPVRPTTSTRRSRRHVADLVDDGDTLQVGVGSIARRGVRRACPATPTSVFHTGMITDGVMTPDREGRPHRRPQGDRPADWSSPAPPSAPPALRPPRRDCPVLVPRSQLHARARSALASSSRWSSINSAIEVDLLGQVGAEMSRGTTSVPWAARSTSAAPPSLTGARSIDRAALHDVRWASRRSSSALDERRGHHRPRRRRLPSSPNTASRT